MRIHLVARSIFPLQPLASHEACGWLWVRLRAGFPNATDCTLMPNGLHLISEARDADTARAALVGVLGGFGRRYGGRIWEPVPEGAVVSNHKHHRRHSRYLALNPSRDGLVRDPLEWSFSSYRDVMGAVVDPWVSAERLAAALRLPAAGFRESFHAYVSGDPTVAVTGTPPPIPAAPTKVCEHPLRRIRLAAAAATRRHPDAIAYAGVTRELFVALARDQGWGVGAIEAACAMSRRQIHRVGVPPATLDAARTCLGDDRLLLATSDLADAPCLLNLRSRTRRDVRRDRLRRRHPAHTTQIAPSMQREASRVPE